MPTDECIVDNYKKSKGEYPNSISFEREIEEAKKWVANENLKFAEKYPDQIPQPEQTGHYHIVRNLLFAVKKLTARAEQAEAEIDLIAIRIMRHIIDNDVEVEEWNEPCVLCEHYNTAHGKCGSCYSTENFELRNDLRGLPQDGEGKK